MRKNIFIFIIVFCVSLFLQQYLLKRAGVETVLNTWETKDSISTSIDSVNVLFPDSGTYIETSDGSSIYLTNRERENMQ